MILNRIIPVLTISDNRLVKTLKYQNPKYIGDPINAIKIFNDKMVDELVILDINASTKNQKPNFKLIQEMASEAFMPVAYGGGINNIDDAKKIVDLGIEKIILNSVLYKNNTIISDLSKIIGSQSVCISVDIKKNIFGKYKLYFYSGSKSIEIGLESFLNELANKGAGEIIINDISRDGTFDGYNLDLLNYCINIKLPIILLGGCKNYENIKEAINKGASATAAGSLFVFKNNDRNSILISYKNKI